MDLDKVMPVAIAGTMEFEIQQKDFIQILHNGYGHWLTVNTIGCQEAEIYLSVSRTRLQLFYHPNCQDDKCTNAESGVTVVYLQLHMQLLLQMAYSQKSVYVVSYYCD